jgi:hypothetical protein
MATDQVLATAMDTAADTVMAEVALVLKASSAT